MIIYQRLTCIDMSFFTRGNVFFPQHVIAVGCFIFCFIGIGLDSNYVLVAFFRFSIVLGAARGNICSERRVQQFFGAWLCCPYILRPWCQLVVIVCSYSTLKPWNCHNHVYLIGPMKLPVAQLGSLLHSFDQHFSRSQLSCKKPAIVD